MSFSEAFDSELPVKATIGGKEISFPLLTCDDHAKWLSQIIASRVMKGSPRIPTTASTADRLEALARLEEEPGLHYLASLCYTLGGAKRVLASSLEKGGVSVKEIPGIISQIPSRKQVELAIDVSALFEKKKPEEKPGPNAESSSSETGLSSDSSSPTSAPEST